VQTHVSRQGFVPNTRNHQIGNWRSINMAQNVADILREMLESAGVNQDKK
jgi:hypothetical protein